MSGIWEVMTLKLGEFTVDKSLETLSKDIGTTMKIPVLAVAIYGEDRKVLVDTGVSDPEWVNTHIAPFEQRRDEGMEAILDKALGWKPKNVDTVINTHLHHDHCGNNNIFKNARFFVQKREWHYAFSPMSVHESIYQQKYFGKGAVNYFQWEHVDGEKEILPGIIVFPTPGHSRGHQSVIVNTAEGVLCIAGDACNLVENIEQMLPPAITTSAEEAIASLQEIRVRAKLVIPGHDPCIKSMQKEDFPEIH